MTLQPIMSEIVINIVGGLITSKFSASLGKLGDKLFWRQFISRFVNRLRSGYAEFERVEGEEIFKLDREFFSDPEVKQVIINYALTGIINKEALRTKFVSLHGDDSIDLFNQNLEAACQLLETMVEEELDPNELIVYRRIQTELQVILSNQGLLLEGQTEIIGRLESIQARGSVRTDYPSELVNSEIEKELEILRKARFFIEFDRKQFSLTLARKLIEGELSGGSDEVRGQALAWCARVLTPTEELDKAEEYLEVAKTLSTSPEIKIAEAFVLSQKKSKSQAMGILAAIDSPISRTASLMVVANHDGHKEALNWLKNSGISITGLDSDGKYFLITIHFEFQNWTDALDCLDALEPGDFKNTPVLHHSAAMINLISTVPEEFRSVVKAQIPFASSDFPLASDQESIEKRRTAKRQFREITQIAKELDLPKAKTVADEYALWLELKDPKSSEKGIERLKSMLRDIKSAIRLVPLALQFGIDLDLDAVEQEIEKEIALNGEMTSDAAIARFALAFTQQSPEDVADYISRYRDQLSKYINQKFLYFTQIEMLAKAGLTERAKMTLEKIDREETSDKEKAHLLQVIDAAEGIDPRGSLKQQFRTTNSLSDLISLVTELEATENWKDLQNYGEILFKRTNALEDAERLAKALNNLQQFKRLHEFLEENSTIVDQSRNLKLLHCWALFMDGRLLEAQSKITTLAENWDDENYRTLQIGLRITMGQWGSLASIVENEFRNQENRSAKDLLYAAQIALYINSPYAKKLLFAAASRGSNDAVILSNAYYWASAAGWEDDPGIIDWLHKAADLSSDEGPIKRLSVREVFDQKPDWNAHEYEIWKQLRRGIIPMFMAAQSLNKSLIDLMLFPALTNQTKNDPRKVNTVPAFSGKLIKKTFKRQETVGIGPTALLTLSFLGLLDEVFDAFNTIFIPHSTLTWLFNEKQRASFHQPSRIADAHKLRHLLSINKIIGLEPSTAPNSNLVDKIGKELAMLIAEAENIGSEDRSQRVVVRPSPVRAIASMMEEEADLTAHHDVLSSCRVIVDKLRDQGQITANEYEKAKDYLKLQEKPWPNQPEIANDAILYLDDLAVSYFLHLGLIDKLQPAGFKTILSPRKISEINSLISYKKISSEADEVIERIRDSISSGIKIGKVKVDRQVKSEQFADQSIPEHPAYGVIQLARKSETIIADDRFINRHSVVNGENPTPIFSTLDLLDGLISTGVIPAENRSEYRTLLRKSGYIFLPVYDTEMMNHLKASKVDEGKVIETAELKAIRENILQVRMDNWLQLPDEAPWLDSTLKVFIRVMKGLWRDDADISISQARSNWILDQIKLRGWAHSLVAINGDDIVEDARGLYTVMILSPPSRVSSDIKDKYMEWVDDMVLEPIKEEDPKLFSWLAEWHKEFIERTADMDMLKGHQE